MFATELLSKKSSVGRRLAKLKAALLSGSLRLSKSRSLVFLCGANQNASNLPSKRRLDIKRHLEKQLPNLTVLFAEGVLREIQQHGKHKNALDTEHAISEIADSIIIVLESESAFCELGAFAHEKLRSRLIVINDVQFKASESFINIGPIKAIEESVSPKNILWYPMGSDGIVNGDGIGATFAKLEELLQPKRSHPNIIGLEECHPKNRTKESLFFLHDLIYLLGPISNIELSDILKILFSPAAYDQAKNLIGILRASGLIHTSGTSPRILRSLERSTFFTFPFSTDSLTAAFRAYHLRSTPFRFSA